MCIDSAKCEKVYINDCGFFATFRAIALGNECEHGPNHGYYFHIKSYLILSALKLYDILCAKLSTALFMAALSIKDRSFIWKRNVRRYFDL